MPRPTDTPHRAVVYICHPYRNNVLGNLERVTELCVRLRRSCVPLAPQLLLPAYIDEETERELALEHCVRLVGVADQVRVYGEPTEGMLREIAEAERLGIPVVRERATGDDEDDE
jgi:hypothetical protein